MRARSAAPWHIPGRVYEPTPEAPWNLRRVVHLHRRAGFAASWSEIQRDLAEGPEASIARLLDGKARPPGAPEPEEFERISTVLGDAAIASSDAGRLKAWWFYRMLFSPDPLGERLTLMWHNHFATSNRRSTTRRPCGARTSCSAAWPARRSASCWSRRCATRPCLIWLDAPANRKGHPNENLARELMELFTLGIGHLLRSRRQGDRAGPDRLDRRRRRVPRGPVAARRRSQDDPRQVRELARRRRGPDPPGATGDGRSAGRGGSATSSWAKGGDKAGDRRAGGRPAVAPSRRRLGRRHGASLARVLRAVQPGDARAGPGRIRRRRGARPGAARPAAEHAGAGRLGGPAGAGPLLSAQRRRLARGRSWLSARSLIGRANFATALVDGRGVGREVPLDPIALAGRHGRGRDRVDTISVLRRAPAGLRTRWPLDRTGWRRPRRERSAGTEIPPGARLLDLLAAPEAQLG